MLRLRIFLPLIIMAMLTGCIHRVKPDCAPPGAVQTTSGCYYVLEITGSNKTTGEAIGNVPKTVVEDNDKKLGTWSWWQWGGWFFRRLVGGTDTYPFFQYQFPIENADPAKIEELVNMKQPVDFQSKAGKRALSLGKPSPEATMKKVENPCVPPGQTATQRCYYKLTITQIDETTGSVKGIVPSSVMEDNAKRFPHLAAKVHRSPEYTFRARESKDLTQGSDYDFVSVPDTDVLQKCIKQGCDEFFPRKK